MHIPLFDCAAHTNALAFQEKAEVEKTVARNAREARNSRALDWAATQGKQEEGGETKEEKEEEGEEEEVKSQPRSKRKKADAVAMVVVPESPPPAKERGAKKTKTATTATPTTSTSSTPSVPAQHLETGKLITATMRKFWDDHSEEVDEFKYKLKAIVSKPWTQEGSEDILKLLEAFGEKDKEIKVSCKMKLKETGLPIE
jgi:hypothetical protein